MYEEVDILKDCKMRNEIVNLFEKEGVNFVLGLCLVERLKLKSYVGKI